MGKELNFESTNTGFKSMGFKASGFGADSPRSTTGSFDGDGIDKASVDYNAQTGSANFKVRTSTSPEISLATRMSAGKAATFLTVMNAALTATIGHTHPKAMSFDDIKDQHGTTINSNAMKKLLTDTRSTVRLAMDNQTPPAETMKKLFEGTDISFQEATAASNQKHVQDGNPQLMGTHTLTGQNGQSVSLSKDGKQLWDGSLDHGSGDWVKGDVPTLLKHISKTCSADPSTGAKIAAFDAAQKMQAQISRPNGEPTTAAQQVAVIMNKGKKDLDTYTETEKFDQVTVPGQTATNEKALPTTNRTTKADIVSKNGAMTQMGIGMTPSPAA